MLDPARLRGFIGSEKVTTTFTARLTPTLPCAGSMLTTVGGVVSAPLTTVKKNVGSAVPFAGRHPEAPPSWSRLFVCGLAS